MTIHEDIDKLIDEANEKSANDYAKDIKLDMEQHQVAIPISYIKHTFKDANPVEIWKQLKSLAGLKVLRGKDGNDYMCLGTWNSTKLNAHIREFNHYIKHSHTESSSDLDKFIYEFSWLTQKNLHISWLRRLYKENSFNDFRQPKVKDRVTKEIESFLNRSSAKLDGKVFTIDARTKVVASANAVAKAMVDFFIKHSHTESLKKEAKIVRNQIDTNIGGGFTINVNMNRQRASIDMYSSGAVDFLARANVTISPSNERQIEEQLLKDIFPLVKKFEDDIVKIFKKHGFER